MIKQQIRKDFLKKRKNLSKQEVVNKSQVINKNILKLINDFNNIESVGLFYPFNNEVDVLELCPYLEEKKIIVTLPIVKKDDLPLAYHIYSYQAHNVAKGYKGIFEPIHSPVVIPDIIVVSCTAYSKDGFRVGYGGGFYDRTIKSLREKNKTFSTILAAFDMQECDLNFKEQFDQKIDYICTENKSIKV